MSGHHDLPSGAEHQGLIADIALEQVRAERSLLRNEQVPGRMGDHQARPGQQAGFTHLRPDTHRNAAAAGRRDPR